MFGTIFSSGLIHVWCSSEYLPHHRTYPVNLKVPSLGDCSFLSLVDVSVSTECKKWEVCLVVINYPVIYTAFVGQPVPMFSLNFPKNIIILLTYTLCLLIIQRLFMSLFQIRAANLSGDCTFNNEAARFNFGLKQHQQVPAPGEKIELLLAGFRFGSLIWVFLGQACVRGRALRSILAVRNISREEAEKIVDEVFDTCFNDHAPFGRIPHSKKDARFAYRDYENRDRYYANL